MTGCDGSAVGDSVLRIPLAILQIINKGLEQVDYIMPYVRANHTNRPLMKKELNFFGSPCEREEEDDESK